MLLMCPYCQISNCQGLGRKNKHEILKTDRIIYIYIYTYINGNMFINTTRNDHNDDYYDNDNTIIITIIIR